MPCSGELISAAVFAVLFRSVWRWCVWTYSQMLCAQSAMRRSEVNGRCWFGHAQKWLSSSSLSWWNMVSVSARQVVRNTKKVCTGRLVQKSCLCKLTAVLTQFSFWQTHQWRTLIHYGRHCIMALNGLRHYAHVRSVDD